MRSAASIAFAACLVIVVASVVLAHSADAPYLWIPHAIAWVGMILVLLCWGVPNKGTVMLVGALALCFVATLFSAYHVHERPLSDDVYRYIWDGHVTVSGINPYAYPPEAEELQALAVQASERVNLPATVKYPHLPTIYPPGAQLVFALVTIVGGTTLDGWLLAWHGLIGVLGLLVLRSVRPRHRLLAMAMLLNPLVVIHGFREPHVDLVMALLTVLCLTLLERGSTMSSGVTLGFAIATKYLSAIVGPVLLVARDARKRWLILVALATTAAVYAPFVGHDVLGSLGTFATKFQANSLAATIMLSFGAEPRVMHATLLVSMGLGAGYALWRWRLVPAYAVSAATMVMMCVSPAAHPWYMALPVLLFVLAPTRSVIVATLTSPLYLVGWHRYTNGGAWDEGAAVLLAEWLPIVACVVADVVRPPRWTTSEPPSA